MTSGTCTRRDVAFPSSGDECRARLFLPDAERPPLVILGHGLGATREYGLEPYARRFADAGITALVFTYRHFGDSGGHPRQLLDIGRQLDDWAAALAYARTLNEVDPTRIALWGTSFGGGHVLVAAARDGGVAATVAEYENEPALRTPDGAVAWTWGEHGRRAAAAAAGLAALGVDRGSVVACWLTNRPEFHAVDIAAALLGAASFSIYPTYTTEQAAHILWDAGSRALITEPAFLERALAVRASGATALETIVCVGEEHERTVGWNELLTSAGEGAALEELANSATADDLLTIIYTSGTTGPPKGVELSHGNVLAQVRATSAGLGLSDRMRVISYLPMAHIAERLVTHDLPIAYAWRVTTCADARTIGTLLPEVRPQVFFSPPRMWERMRAATIAKLGEDPDGATALRALGLDAVRVAVTGAAPCPADVIEFWGARGLPLCEVYGMSETTGVATVNPAGALRPGTVGVGLPGVEVALWDTGEVPMRGPVIMRGYRNRPDATAEAIDADGWMHSGDVGVIDDDGYLRIVDRIKELIISAAGKNMSPANIEATIKASGSLIGNACAIGDAKPYNVALVTLDPEAAATVDDAHAEVEAQIALANERLARVEQLKRFTVLAHDWLADGDELTPTSKLKRRAIAAKYATEIEGMYAGS